MAALIVLACIVLVIVVLLLLRVGVRADYSQDGFSLDLKLGFLHLRLLPGKEKTETQKRKQAEKDKKKKEKKAKKKAAKKDKEEKPEEKKKKGDLSWLLQLISPAMTALGRLRRKLRVKYLRVDYSVPGAGDPAGAALRYGQISAGGGALFPMLCAVLDVEDWDVHIDVDFLAEKTRLTLSAEADYRVGTLLHIVFALGLSAITAYLHRKKEPDPPKGQTKGRKPEPAAGTRKNQTTDQPSGHDEEEHHGRQASDR